MQSNARAVAREMRLIADRSLSPNEIARAFAVTVRAERDRLIAEGRASPQYTTTVDGRDGAAEETVRTFSGYVQYDFGDLTVVIATLVGYLIGLSPNDTGAFRKSWAIAVDGRPFDGDTRQIPPRSEIMIVNLAPYSRKVETGAMPGARAGKLAIEAARQFAQRKFPHYGFAKSFVNLPSSFGSLTTFEVPYILRGHQRSFASRYTTALAMSGGQSVRTARSELTRGNLLAYPALIFSRKAG